MKDACQELNRYSYISLDTKQRKVLKGLKEIFELEEDCNEDRHLRIRQCDWGKFKNFTLDILKMGIKEGRKREKIDIKKLINKRQ